MSFSTFRNRMGVKGNSSYDRKLKSATRDFQQWFDNALGREWVSIDDVEQYAVFQDQNQNNNKDLSDDKYIIVENSSNIKVGSYVKWREMVGMVFTDEMKTIPTHKQAKLKESNHVIRWMIDGKVCNNGKGYHAFIQNQTLYTLGVSTSGSNAWIVNAKMMMYLPNNDESRAMKIGQRIVIGGAVYQIMFMDYVSRQGLINYLLEQDMVSSEYDNLELGIADYYSDKNTDTTDTVIVGSPKELVITGVEKAKIGSLVKFEANVYKDGILQSEGVTEWTIADTESAVTIEDQDDKSITLRVIKNYQKVGSVISVIAKTSDGVIGSKSVNIISLY